MVATAARIYGPSAIDTLFGRARGGPSHHLGQASRKKGGGVWRAVERYRDACPTQTATGFSRAVRDA
eukprot:10789239-Lingulodinium_polyedra.AAC.1